MWTYVILTSCASVSCALFLPSQNEDGGHLTTEKEIACPHPGDIQHGKTVVWGNGFLLEYMCDDGFQAVGVMHGSCVLTTGEWSIDPPVCIANGCPHPGHPINGQVTLEYDNGIARFSCNRGYQLIGSHFNYCNGTDWRGHRPLCTDVKVGRPPRQQEDLVKFRQDRIKAHQENFLQSDSSCVHYYRPPPAIPHGKVSLDYVFHDTRREWVMLANYTCNPPYRLENNETRYLYCKRYKWSAPLQPKCVPGIELESACSKNKGRCEHICLPRSRGRYTCSCYHGYSLSIDGRHCNDLDECENNNGGCAQNCQNMQGSYFCTCQDGYLPAGNACVDLDECQNPRKNKCPGPCINTEGSFKCDCDETPGYQTSVSRPYCEDRNECLLNNGGCSDVCENSHGSYRCRCEGKGFQLSSNQRDCDDINECVRYGRKLCKHGRCHNTVGSYRCECMAGYRAGARGSICEDEDECLVNNGGCEDTCQNTIGSFKCLCQRSGFRLSHDLVHCEDINECLDNNGGCDDTCLNSIGSFTCRCTTFGFVLDDDNMTCTSCNASQYFSEHSTACLNCPANSHTLSDFATSVADCVCLRGYSGHPAQGIKCRDINECEEANLGCSFGCENVQGGAYCTCPNGYDLSANARDCADNDECLNDNGGCGDTCVNTEGSFHCECQSPSFRLAEDGLKCTDIDECTDGDLNCSDICINTWGSAHCACHPGYALNKGGKNCDDVNECNPGLHNCDDICLNTQGSYYCACAGPGYKLSWDKKTCVDINECMEGRNPCDDGCANTQGSFECTCSQSGHRLSEDGYRCIDIDECASKDTNDCQQLCTNTDGQYICRCEPGFVSYGYNKCEECPAGTYTASEFKCRPCPELTVTNGSGKSTLDDCHCLAGYKRGEEGKDYCIDIDECQNDNFGCTHHCYNTYGGAYCYCSPGYRVATDGKRCNDINECHEENGGCQQGCRNLPGTRECFCESPGFYLDSDGHSCQDVDECTENNYRCSHICVNTRGAAYCLCPPGFSLGTDGNTCTN